MKLTYPSSDIFNVVVGFLFVVPDGKHRNRANTEQSGTATFEKEGTNKCYSCFTRFLL